MRLDTWVDLREYAEEGALSHGYRIGVQAYRNVDGLVQMLSVDQIAEHLGDRFRLLTGGSRTAVERQRTLRAMMDWSYDLLSTGEQALLRRLAVFAGQFSYEAAEQVAASEDLPQFEILDLLGRLRQANNPNCPGCVLENRRPDHLTQ